MDEAAFLRELGKYRVVRRRDFVDTSGFVRKAATAPTSTVAATVVDSKSTQLIPQQSSHVDFWAGLEALLKRHVPNSAQRELVARAFDEIHYTRIRSLNLEDADDLAACFARELSGAPPEPLDVTASVAAPR